MVLVLLALVLLACFVWYLCKEGVLEGVRRLIRHFCTKSVWLWIGAVILSAALYAVCKELCLVWLYSVGSCAITMGAIVVSGQSNALLAACFRLAREAYCGCSACVGSYSRVPDVV